MACDVSPVAMFFFLWGWLSRMGWVHCVWYRQGSCKSGVVYLYMRVVYSDTVWYKWVQYTTVGYKCCTNECGIQLWYKCVWYTNMAYNFGEHRSACGNVAAADGSDTQVVHIIHDTQVGTKTQHILGGTKDTIGVIIIPFRLAYLLYKYPIQISDKYLIGFLEVSISGRASMKNTSSLATLETDR